MRALEQLKEWLTHAKKRQFEDESMNAACRKLDETLEGLRLSNRQLAESMKDKEIQVRVRDA